MGSLALARDDNGLAFASLHLIDLAFCQTVPMLAKIYSAAVYGVDAYEVEIEVNDGGGEPKIVIVGLPDTAVKESRDRVTTAISNSGYHWPRGRTTINLAPADIKKEGPSFDLPIALGMIALTKKSIRKKSRLQFCRRTGVEWRRPPGERRAAGRARSAPAQTRAIIVPEANAREAAMVEGIDDLRRAESAADAFQFVRGETAHCRCAAISPSFSPRIKITRSISPTSKARVTSSARSKSRSPAGTTFS